MISVNDITGDLIRTKRSNDAYREGWNTIFGNQSKKTDIVPLEEFQKTDEASKTTEYTALYFKCVEHAFDGSSAVDGYYAFADEERADAYIKNLQEQTDRQAERTIKLELIREGTFPISELNFGALQVSPMGFLCFQSIRKAAR